MDLLHGNIKVIFFKYFTAAFGSALISSIYGLVDMAMVGQYQGPQGSGALAVVAPVWNIIYSLGLLTGIGGSVLYSAARGMGHKGEKHNEYFTAALLLTGGLALLSWLAVAFFDGPLLTLFGADDTLLPLAKSYLLPVKFAVPCFLFNQMLAAFLRNDNAPGLAARAVLFGGIFNIFGDWFFVFKMDMGIIGAGLATSIGAFLTLIVMLSHFASGKNTLKLCRPRMLFQKMKNITETGFASFFMDVSMGIVTMFFNRQIMTWSGSGALAVYGVIVNISTIVQCCAYSVGQAAQPIISMNFGAGQYKRIRGILKYALYTAGFFSLFWTGIVMSFPNSFIHIFMDATKEVLEIAPEIMRKYAASFLLLPLNIFAAYYFQSVMRSKVSFILSLMRGLVVSGCLIYLLPVIGGGKMLWWAMPLTELLTALPAVYLMWTESTRRQTV